MDLARFEETPVFFFSPEVHCTDFFEILIFREGNGFLLLDGKKIPLAGYTFIFVSPFQKFLPMGASRLRYKPLIFIPLKKESW